MVNVVLAEPNTNIKTQEVFKQSKQYLLNAGEALKEARMTYLHDPEDAKSFVAAVEMIEKEWKRSFERSRSGKSCIPPSPHPRKTRSLRSELNLMSTEKDGQR
jgi:hypothetical protein